MSHGAVVATNQATDRVRENPSKASDGHSGDMERVSTPLARKSGASGRYYSKAKREERLAILGLIISDRKINFSLLEKDVPLSSGKNFSRRTSRRALSGYPHLIYDEIFGLKFSVLVIFC